MNKAEKLHQKIMAEFREFGPVCNTAWLRKIETLKDASTKYHDFWDEALGKGGRCVFYQWLYYLVKVLQPKVVVEMGADSGGSAIFILSALPEDGTLYSIDVRGEEPHAWEYVPKWDNRIIKLPGDDTNLTTYPDDFPWRKVNLWFIDSHHTWEHVQKQMNLIRPYIEKGTVILNHDIYVDNAVIAKGLKKKYHMWDWWEDNREIFNQGIGVFVI